MTDVPVAINLSEGVVHLAKLPAEVLHAPFFDEAASRHLRLGATTRAVGLKEWLGGESTSHEPLGFIFHVGRCGSSLLSRLLETVDDLTVVREANALTRALHALSWSRTTMAATEALAPAVMPGGTPEEAAQVVRRVASAFCAASAKPDATLLKFQPADVREAKELMRLFPKSRCVFVERDEWSVVGSMMRRPPSMFSQRLVEQRQILQIRYPSMRRSTWNWPSLPLLAVHTWKTAMDSADHISDERLLRINYEALVQDTRAVVGQALEHLALTDADPHRLQEVLAFDAHSPINGAGEPVRFASTGSAAADLAKSDPTVRSELEALKAVSDGAAASVVEPVEGG